MMASFIDLKICAIAVFYLDEMLFPNAKNWAGFRVQKIRRSSPGKNFSDDAVGKKTFFGQSF